MFVRVQPASPPGIDPATLTQLAAYAAVPHGHRAGFPVPARPGAWARSPRSLAIEDDLRAGLTDAAVARRHGVSPARVREIRIRAGIPVQPHGWTEAERTLVIAHQDRSAREVAALLGRTVRAVDGERSRLIRQGRIRAKIVRERTTGEPGP